MKFLKNKAFTVFLKSMLFTASAIILIAVGYFSAGYFFAEF